VLCEGGGSGMRHGQRSLIFHPAQRALQPCAHRMYIRIIVPPPLFSVGQSYVRMQ